MIQKEKIKLRKFAVYRDGGTMACIDKDGKTYFIDNRIGTQTEGKVYSNYPSQDKAKLLDIEYELIEGEF